MRVQHRVLAGAGTALALLCSAANAQIGGLVARDLAGNNLSQYPFFEYVRAFNEGSPVRAAIDPGSNPGLVGQTVDVYVCASQNIAAWTSNPALIDVSSGGFDTVTVTGSTIQANTWVLDSGTLNGNAGLELGVPYDVVIDVNQNGILDPGDYIDGYSNAEAGLYVCHDTVQPGPLSVTDLPPYDLSGAAWDEQDTFYPANIASMGELPLVVVSHGNGHNYQWYDHIGTHLASYGYVVMSHSNATGAGVVSASGTTLSNTDAFLNNLATIGGGVLQGHVDTNNILWIGHSRGGEGVVIAYHRVVTGAFVPQNYTADDIKLVSSIAPVDFQTLASFPPTDPHSVNYHLWTGGSDADVNGCASCNLCQTFHLHDRAQQYRQSISLHGVGHGDFHNGGGSSVATGPCLVGRLDTHKIVKGYLLPLVERYYDGNVPALDYLTRQWESFHPPGAPIANPCVVVDLMYRDGSAPGKVVLDDYQSNPALNKASSGLNVAATVTGLTEGKMDDNNTTFTDVGAADIWNGFTVAGTGPDNSAGAVFEWDGGNTYYALVAPGGGPLSLWKTISFRACQATRDALTTAALGDLTFNVTVLDTNGTFSRINIGAFGGGVEEPYQRSSCGIGLGWANEFETIRIPIEAFRYNNSGINLTSILAVGFEFGPAHGSAQGRIGIDDIELLLD